MPVLPLTPVNGYVPVPTSGVASTCSHFIKRNRGGSSHLPWNSTVAEATHQMLTDHRSIDHIPLFQSHSRLQEELEQTKKAYKNLSVRFETLRCTYKLSQVMLSQFLDSAAYSELVKAVASKLSSSPAAAPVSSGNLLAPSSSVTSTAHLELLKRSDYDDIHFWTELEYLQEFACRQKAKGKVTMEEAKSKCGSKHLSEDDLNIMCWYIEDEKGIEVSGSRIKAIYYASEMRVEFPELRLCDLDYKLHRIATDIYPGWSKSYFKKHGSIKRSKVDPAFVDQQASDLISGAKHEALEPPAAEPVAKKWKKTQSSCTQMKPNKTLTETALDAATPSMGRCPRCDMVPQPAAPLTVSSAMASAAPETAANLGRPVLISKVFPMTSHDAVIVPTAVATTPEMVKNIQDLKPPSAAASPKPIPNPMKRVSEGFPGKSTGPTTRLDFVETTSKKDQKKKSLSAPGPAKTSASVSGKISYLRVTNSTKPRVTKVVFDAYMANLSPAELKPHPKRLSIFHVTIPSSQHMTQKGAGTTHIVLGSGETSNEVQGSRGDEQEWERELIVPHYNCSQCSSSYVQIGKGYRGFVKNLDISRYFSLFVAGVLTGDEH
ncbi:hypothetical protein B0H10DRAFT_1940086 [Mycena sp. CBHHK59/15]|nr:hypothetical protein B0H10DRAFT_1940086 [Mycena sp. CBHHK59/15]